MRELIEKIEAAKSEQQKALLREVIDLACRQGWISPILAEDAATWNELGAHESAALTLVPEGWWWELNAEHALLGPPDSCDGCYGKHKHGEGATPALALVAACLRVIDAADATRISARR